MSLKSGASPRVWQRPSLMALVRASKEEAVLGFCKTAAMLEYDQGPSGYYAWTCTYYQFDCVACSSVGSS